MWINAEVVGEVPAAEYHAQENGAKPGDAEYVLSRSGLVEFSKNPHKWVSLHEDKNTDAMAWGSALDTYVLQPETMSDIIAVKPVTYINSKEKEMPFNMNSNWCKEWMCQNADKVIISAEQARQLDQAQERLYDDKIITEILNTSQKQVMATATWREKTTAIEVPFKILIDIVPEVDHDDFGQFLFDLKTTKDASENAWVRTIYNFGLYIQAAIYLDVWEAATDENRTEFGHIVSESCEPFETARRMLNGEFLEMGRMEYENQLNRYCRCLRDGVWPGYDETETQKIKGFAVMGPLPWMGQD